MPQPDNRTDKLAFFSAHLAGIALLLIPAFYNGYGIVNADVGTLLLAGFKPDMPVDRPITYGILLRVFSLNGLTLWLVLVAQAFFVSNLVIRIVRLLVLRNSYLWVSVGILAFLSLLTGLSWTASQLQPDIFTGIAVMCIALLIGAEEGRRTTILTYILYFVAVGTHASHLVLSILLLLSVIIVFRRTVYRGKKKQILTLLVLSVAPVLTMMPIFPKSGHMFFMSSLMEKGILKDYLDENCGKMPLKLCAYKDHLPPTADEYLWASYSPVQVEGGWAAMKDEHQQIISDIRTSPKYIGKFAVASFQFTLRQLCMFEIGPGNVPLKKGTTVHDRLERYLPHELEAFTAARQYNDTLLPATTLPNKIFTRVIQVCGILLSLSLLLFRKKTSPEFRLVIFLFLAGILLNAWDCATFSVLNGRYGCRTMWLIPLGLLLFIFSDKKKVM